MEMRADVALPGRVTGATRLSAFVGPLAIDRVSRNLLLCICINTSENCSFGKDCNLNKSQVGPKAKHCLTRPAKLFLRGRAEAAGSGKRRRDPRPWPGAGRGMGSSLCPAVRPLAASLPLPVACLPKRVPAPGTQTHPRLCPHAADTASRHAAVQPVCLPARSARSCSFLKLQRMCLPLKLWEVSLPRAALAVRRISAFAARSGLRVWRPVWGGRFCVRRSHHASSRSISGCTQTPSTIWRTAPPPPWNLSHS